MKKNSLTKRIVSLITAVGLTLTSTVMLIPASAANVGDACSQTAECTGTYAWVDTEGTHTLQCNVCNVPDPDTVAHTYDAENTVEGCTACEEAAAQEPDVTNYTVTVSEVDNGTITAAYGEAQTIAEGANAAVAENTEITLTAVADENYTFTNWVINGENGATEATTTVTVTAETTISAVFTAVEPQVTLYKVTVAETTNGTVTVAPETATTDGVAAETEVTLTVTPAEGYEVEAVSYTAEGGEATTVEAVDGVYSFAMPAANVTVTATFKEAASEEEPEEKTAGWADNGDGSYTYTSVLGTPSEDDAEGTPRDTADKNISIDISELIADGKGYDDIASISVDVAVSPYDQAVGGCVAISGIAAPGEDSGWVQVDANSTTKYTVETPYGVYDNEKFQVQLWWANADSTFTVSNIQIEYATETYNVTIAEGIENGTVEADVTEAAEGDKVTLTVKGIENYEVDTLVVSYTDAEGEEKTVEVADDYTFVMPAADVTVTATFVEHIYPFVITASDKSTGSFDTWEDAALFIADETLDYTITVNKDVELSTKFALPKKAKSLMFTGEGSLTFTGTKLAVPVDTMFDVKLAAKNKTNLIDITVAKDVMLYITGNAYTVDEEEEVVQFINKLTGTKTSKFYGMALVNNIATFGEVNVIEDVYPFATLAVNDGKATGIAKLGGRFAIRGSKATAAITEVTDEAVIGLMMNADGTLPKVTIDKFGKAVEVEVFAEDGLTTALPSGTTIFYTKNPIPTGDDAIVVNNKTALENGEELTAYYYAKTKSIKAEVGTALDLYMGEEATEETKVGNYPNFELLFAEITDPAADYIINVNTDLTLDAKFALPKTAKSITLTGNGSLTLTGTKLAIPVNTTLDVEIKAVNKTNLIDISVAKDKTLEITINAYTKPAGPSLLTSCINKLTGTKTSKLKGLAMANSISTFAEVEDLHVNGGKATGIAKLNGLLVIEGAKATADITTIVPGSLINFRETNGVIPKVTLGNVGEAVEGEETITVRVYQEDSNINLSTLASGTTILYAKKAGFDTSKIEIANNGGSLKPYAYGKVIKAEYPQAVTVDNLNTTGEAGSETNAELEKDYPNFEAAVAAIDAAKDDKANYVITLNQNVAPAKFALPKYAASVKLTCEEAAYTINVGKATAITANTDLEIENVEFVTTGKTLTITAKKNLTIDELYGNVTAIKGAAKFALNWNGENENTAKADITGFGTVNVNGTLTTGKNFNVTKLVLGEAENAGTLVVSAATAKASIKALDATNGGAIRYEEGAKALTFTGKDADFTGTLKITGAVANGQAVLTTKNVSVDKLADGITAQDSEIKYGFTQMGKDICYMGKVLSVTAIVATESLGEATAYATWNEVVAAMTNADADYTITLLDDYNANAAIKFPKAGTYKSITIESAQDNDAEGDEIFNFNFTGNLALTGDTRFFKVNLGAVKNGAPAKYTINAGKNPLAIFVADTNDLTSISSTVLVSLFDASADKIKAGDLYIGGNVEAIGGITAKNVDIDDQGVNLVMNQGSKLAITGNVTNTDSSKITVKFLDKKTGEPAALKNNYVVATIKGTGAENIVLDEAHTGFALNFNKGKLVVVEAAEEEDDVVTSFWTVNGNTYTFKSVYGSKTGEDDTEFDVAGGEADPYEKGQVDIVALLEEGKTINDIRSITLNFSVNNTANPAAWVSGSAGMCINPNFTWAQTSNYQPDSEAGTYAGSVVLETPEGVSPDNKLLIGVDWANPDSECSFTVELTYAE